MKSKKMVLIIILALIILPVNNVNASWYGSTIRLNSNEQFSGKARSYDSSNYGINIRFDKILGNDPKYTVVSLNKKGLFGSHQYKRVVKSFSLNKTVKFSLGSAGKGSRYFAFGSYQNALTDGKPRGTVYAGYESYYVEMYSY